jgi:phosphoglycolate phosphatase
MRGVIFDLDGTLVDSLGDIAAAMNRSLAARGFPTHPVDAYRTFIGEGVQKLAERALPPGKQEEKAALLQAYQADYAENLLETSAPYPGIPELLDALSTRGIPMAVLSNKPDAPTRRIVETLLGRWRFQAVAGERPGVPRKPDPAAALELARAMDVAASAVAFVGDTLVDVFTARAAGMRPLGVLWGFRAQEVAASGVATVQHPGDLLPLLAE